MKLFFSDRTRKCLLKHDALEFVEIVLTTARMLSGKANCCGAIGAVERVQQFQGSNFTIAA